MSLTPVSPATMSSADPSMEVLAVSLSKNQQKADGQTAMKLLESAMTAIPAPSSNPSIGQNVNTYA